MKTIEQVYEKAARDAGFVFSDTPVPLIKQMCTNSGLSLEYALDDFTKHYLIAALWSSNDEDGTPLDEGRDLSDVTYGTIEKAVADCNRFQTENAELLAQAYELYEPRDGYEREALAGHDFWLTRAGHGTGFWDRGLGAVGEKLTDACEPFENVDLYVNDNNKVDIA